MKQSIHTHIATEMQIVINKKKQSSILAQFHTSQKCSKNTCAMHKISIVAYEREFTLYVCAYVFK